MQTVEEGVQKPALVTNAKFTVAGYEVTGDYSDQDNVVVKDQKGNTIKFQKYNDILVSVFFPNLFLRQVRGFSLRPRDVYLAGYPRSGTHWAYEIANKLMRGDPDAVVGSKLDIQTTPADVFDEIPSPRVVNCHMTLSEAPTDLESKRCKIIFTLRDPRDVAVSLYHMTYGRPWSDCVYRGTFADYLHLFLEGRVDYNGLFEYWRAAEKYFNDHPENSVHLQIYEETMKDPVLSVQKMSDFLGLTRDEKLCRGVAEKCTFPNMKESKAGITMKFEGEDILFRQGTSGDWKNYFTSEMLEEYYRVYDEKMAGSRFYHIYAKQSEKIT